MVVAHDEPFGLQNHRDVPRLIFRQILLVIILSGRGTLMALSS